MFTNPLIRYALAVTVSAAALFSQSSGGSLPKGTSITVRTLDSIQSKQGEVGQSYRCTVDQPVSLNGRQAAARGADCVLQIVEMKSAGKLKGSNELQLVLSQIRLNGNLVSVETGAATITGKGKGKSTALRTGIGASAGAGLGAILGGGKGAAIGSGVGAAAGAASSALTSGPEVKVPAETLLTFVVQ
jgi:hypothetical protein